MAASGVGARGAEHRSFLSRTLHDQRLRNELPPQLARPFKIIAFDWDGTAVMSRREDAMWLRQPVEKLLRCGVFVAIITATNFSNIDQQLTAMMRGPYKRNFYVSTNRGSEVYGFDAQSRPVLLWQRLATLEESRLLSQIADAARRALVAKTGLEIRVVYNRLNRRKIDLIPLPAWRDSPKSAISEVLQAVEVRLTGAGLSRGLQEVLQLVERTALERGLRQARLTTDAKQVEVGLTDKSDAMAWLLREVAQRLNIAPEDILIAGDEFGPIAGFEGSDHKMVTRQSKEAMFISVGSEPGGTPPDVMHLSGGPSRFRALLTYQAALLDQRRWPPTIIAATRTEHRNRTATSQAPLFPMHLLPA
jgi:hydroxymethylpyrimidine pyrophosphatase-like HAD family hydrolase